ncbi:MAG: dual specificity protein phosphatase family protein [Verrucomicrobiota bacterium]
MKTYIISTACLLAVGFAVAGEPPGVRPASWAEPVKMAGVPNLHKVAPGLYRSAQPTGEGMRNLKKMGIATVVNLRSFHSDRDELGDTGLASEHIYMKTWHPEREDVVRFLRMVTDSKHGPLLVHCQHGADRTGAMCAIYRVAVQNWSKKEAIREMTEGGFNFHAIWDNLPSWISDLDMQSLRKDSGITIGTDRAAPSDDGKPPKL